MELKEAYKTSEVQKLTGLTWRRLTYWVEIGFFLPSVHVGGKGKGNSHVFSFTDVVELDALRKLRDGGASLQKLRKAKEAMGKLDLRAPFCCLAISGDDILASNDRGEFVSLITQPGQQTLFTAVDIAESRREIEKRIKAEVR